MIGYHVRCEWNWSHSDCDASIPSYQYLLKYSLRGDMPILKRRSRISRLIAKHTKRGEKGATGHALAHYVSIRIDGSECEHKNILPHASL